MHNQSFTLKLDLPEFAVQGIATDQSGNLLVIVKANRLPACPDCGGGGHRYMIGANNGSKIDFLYSYTNGFTEGTNTKNKQLRKRIEYGITSFQKLRNRILS